MRKIGPPRRTGVGAAPVAAVAMSGAAATAPRNVRRERPIPAACGMAHYAPHLHDPRTVRQPSRVDRRRAARAGRAAELPRSPDAGVDEVLGDARHSRHRARGELGHYPRHLQVGLRRAEPDRRLPRRSLFAPLRDRRQPARLVDGHVGNRTRRQLPGAARDARADGHQRGVLHPGSAGPDRRRPSRLDALARHRLPPDGNLLRGDRGRLRRLCRRSSRSRLALGLRTLRH